MSPTIGVGQLASCAVVPSFINPDSCPAALVLAFLANTVSSDSHVSVAEGLGHEPESLSDVRRTDAASR